MIISSDIFLLEVFPASITAGILVEDMYECGSYNGMLPSEIFVVCKVFNIYVALFFWLLADNSCSAELLCVCFQHEAAV